MDDMGARSFRAPHLSENVKPSWFGESIGHYKGGDTLVIDTIGLAAGKYHYIDFLPHAAYRETPRRRAVHNQPGR
jgi:hypothetical protein